MIGYGDIVRELTRTLKNLMPGVTVYAAERVESIKRPAFYFTVKPILTEAANMRTRHNVLGLYIDFFQKVKDEAGMYDVATMVRDALGFAYKVGDHYIDIKDFSYDLLF